ncbi:MAG TPA: leucyl/phenylalanyl-tRNA--protein transferase [Ignavibacteriaceae bacterium]|nr:leucyl/phenylalanyl-tRNA--protein transferase [Ignavibacteriaceae bacterium]
MSNKEQNSNKDLLKPEIMIQLYAKGAFPMADEKTGIINWYLPETRCIIPLNNFNIPRSVKKIIDKEYFEFRFNTDFLSIVKGCADRESTWISDELIKAYLKLQRRGHIQTVEVWKDGVIVGGLYGVSFRGAFFGESMFSKVSQASKAALAKLIYHLKEKDFVLLDVQYMTEHLKMFGAIEISWSEYKEKLLESYLRNCEF